MSITPMQPPPGGPVEQPRGNNTTLIVIIIAAVLLGGCCVIAMVAAIAIPNLIEARKGSNEAAAIGALRTLTTAQALYREGDKDKNQVLDYARDLEDLSHVGLIDGILGMGTKQGYLFRIESADDFRWSASATPQAPGKSGDRSFFVDESGVIRAREATRGTATVQDPPLGSSTRRP